MKQQGWLFAFGALAVIIMTMYARPANAAAGFEGSWISACVADAGKHSKRDLYIVGNHIYSTTSVYSDAGCFNLIMRLEHHSTFDTGSSTSTGTEVDGQSVGSLITVLDAGISDLWASARFCGIVDWDVGIPEDVTGKDCGGHKIPKSGDPDFDLYLRDASGKLWVGERTAALDGSTREKRPKAIDRSRAFRLQ